jgi:hypothetical protein
VPALTLVLPEFEASELFVLIDEGDNTALPLVETRLLLPAYRLRFFREPDARFRLVYGRADLDAPRYDLALLAPQLLGAPAEEIVPDQEEQSGAAADSPLIRPQIFWVLLATAVAALVALIVRLVRDQPVS